MKPLSFEKKKKLEGLFFVSPFIIGLLLFFLYPFYTSFKLSFGENVSIQGFQIEWSGFQNYIDILTVDTKFVPIFLDVVKDTFTKLPLIIVFSLIMAILLNRKIRGRGFFRAAFFMPFLLGTGVVLEQLIDMGAVNQLLSVESAGISSEMIAYLGPQVSGAINSFFSVIVTVLWSTGVQTLMFLSGLQGISESLYESANVDGATAWETFWKITLPMIMPIMLVNIVYTLADSFTNITNPIIEYTQQVAFSELKFENSAAMGMLYLAFVWILVIIVFLVLGRNSIYDSKVKRERRHRR